MKKLARTAGGAMAALTLAVVFAAPAAAARPTRTVTRTGVGGVVGHYPAGTGCTFDVSVYHKSHGWSQATVTEFSDGREVVEDHSMYRVITNDATGATFVDNQEYRDVEWIDPSTALLLGKTSGQFIDTFYPGDVTPDGVADQVVSYAVVGSQTYVLDSTTYATLALTVHGTVTNICAAIS